MADKKTTKINNKKSLNTGIIIKPSKINNKNIVYVNADFHILELQ